MNTLQFSLVLLGMGAFMAILAFGVLYGLASVLDIGDAEVDVRILFTFFAISCLAIYGANFGVFAGVQKDNCGEVKNWKQIALNAAIPLGIHVVLLLLVLFVPWFRNVVGNIFPPDTAPVGKMAAALAYYSFWSTLMGGALGGTLSASCKVEDTALPALAMPTIPAAAAMPLPEEGESLLTNAAGVRFNLPPE